MSPARLLVLSIAKPPRRGGLGSFARMLLLAAIGFGYANAIPAETTQTPSANPVAWLIDQPERWPREVTLLKPTEFPIIENGRPAGSIGVRPGQKIKVVKLEAGRIAAEFLGAKHSVPMEMTDIEQRAIAAMATITPSQRSTASATPASLRTAAPTTTPPPNVADAARNGPPSAPAQFIHPGLLSTQADLKRMAAKVAAGAQPWKGSWDILVANTDITSGGDKPARDPKDWELQASNDGKNWITLNTREGQVFTSRLQTSRYHIGNRTAYRDYRLNLRANAGGDSTSGFQLAELALPGENDRAQAGVSSR